MDFVDDINLVTSIGRLVTHAVQNLADVVNAGSRCGVKLQHVNMPSFGNGFAVVADSAGLDGRAAVAVFASTVQCLGNNAGRRSFSDAADAGENIGMMKAVVFNGIGQSLHQRILPEQVVKILRAVFSCQYNVLIIFVFFSH